VRKKGGKQPVNLLYLVPSRNIAFEKDETGRFVLLKPKYAHPFLVKHLLPRLKNPHFKVRLDGIGSATWELCDGKNTVRDIGKRLKERFGEDVEPLYERLGLFFRTLEKQGFIRFKKEELHPSGKNGESR